MRWDLFIVGGGIVAVGFAIWCVCGNPSHSAQTAQVAFDSVHPEFKLITERSPYMRSER
jgi:hypothetical protein